jgi:hypothetical protein
MVFNLVARLPHHEIHEKNALLIFEKKKQKLYKQSTFIPYFIVHLNGVANIFLFCFFFKKKKENKYFFDEIQQF